MTDQATETAEQEIDPAKIELAKKYGYKGEDEWEGDPPPHGFMTPDEFLSRPAVQLRMTTDRLDQVQSEFEAMQERTQREMGEMRAAYDHAAKEREANHKRELERIQSEQRAAVETGDIETYDRLAKYRETFEALSPPEAPPELPPLAKEWKARNGWYEQDYLAKAEANEMMNRIHQAGGDIQAQLEGAERHIRRTFPDLFAEPEKKTPKTRVDSGGLAMGGQKAGWSSLPKDVQTLAMELIEDGVYDHAGDTVDAKKAAYFESYKKQVMGDG